MKPHDIEIPLEALENGYFLVGVRAAGNAMNNYHKRLAAARLARSIESQSKPLLVDLNDMIRTFGTANARGVVEVDTTRLDKEKADQWMTAYEEWKAKTITVTSDLVVDGKIKLEFSKAEADKFPTICLEVMDPYIEIAINDETEIQSLKNEVNRLKAQISATPKE